MQLQISYVRIQTLKHDQQHRTVGYYWARYIRDAVCRVWHLLGLPTMDAILLPNENERRREGSDESGV